MSKQLYNQGKESFYTNTMNMLKSFYDNTTNLECDIMRYKKLECDNTTNL